MAYLTDNKGSAKPGFHQTFLVKICLTNENFFCVKSVKMFGRIEKKQYLCCDGSGDHYQQYLLKIFEKKNIKRLAQLEKM